METKPPSKKCTCNTKTPRRHKTGCPMMGQLFVVAPEEVVALLKERHDPKRPGMNPLRLAEILKRLGMTDAQGPALSAQLKQMQGSFSRYRIRHGTDPIGWVYDPPTPKPGADQ